MGLDMIHANYLHEKRRLGYAICQEGVSQYSANETSGDPFLAD